MYPWIPWNKVVALRPDFKSGELSVTNSTTDFYDMAMLRGMHPTYENPAGFFTLTYPTISLYELTGNVKLRMPRVNDKSIRLLVLARSEERLLGENISYQLGRIKMFGQQIF